MHLDALFEKYEISHRLYQRSASIPLNAVSRDPFREDFATFLSYMFDHV